MLLEEQWEHVEKIETDDVINTKLTAFVYLYIVK